MTPNHLLIVDIETVPDAAHHEGDAFPKPPFHEVVAIGFLHAGIDRSGDGVAYDLQEVRCGGEASYSEAKLLQAFFQFFERHKPRLVTFNGRSFDIPVLKYRAMVHGVPSPSLHSRDYGYRYNMDWHCDLLEALSDFGASTRVKLDEVCKVLGLPGKLGIDGAQASRVSDIRPNGRPPRTRTRPTSVPQLYLNPIRYVSTIRFRKPKLTFYDRAQTLWINHNPSKVIVIRY